MIRISAPVIKSPVFLLQGFPPVVGTFCYAQNDTGSFKAGAVSDCFLYKPDGFAAI